MKGLPVPGHVRPNDNNGGDRERAEPRHADRIFSVRRASGVIPDTVPGERPLLRSARRRSGRVCLDL